MPTIAGARPLRTFGSQDNGSELSKVIEAIGGEGFPEQLLSFLGTVADADHCAIYQLTGLRLDEIGTAGDREMPARQRSETVRYEIKRQLTQIRPADCRVDLGCLHGMETAGLEIVPGGERRSILVSGRKADAAYCVRILCSGLPDGPFDACVARIRDLAQILISLTARHADLAEKKPNLTPALCSLPEIQDCISADTALSRREAEVCARVLYGMTSYGIALDLGIGKESVMTYRKRAYARLGIGSQRELLMWYLARWSEIRGDGDGDITPAARAVVASEPLAVVDASLEMGVDADETGARTCDCCDEDAGVSKLGHWGPHAGLEPMHPVGFRMDRAASPTSRPGEADRKPPAPVIPFCSTHSHRHGRLSVT